MASSFLLSGEEGDFFPSCFALPPTHFLPHLAKQESPQPASALPIPRIICCSFCALPSFLLFSACRRSHCPKRIDRSRVRKRVHMRKKRECRARLSRRLLPGVYPHYLARGHSLSAPKRGEKETLEKKRKASEACTEL